MRVLGSINSDYDRIRSCFWGRLDLGSIKLRKEIEVEVGKGDGWKVYGAVTVCRGIFRRSGRVSFGGGGVCLSIDGGV